MPADAEVVFAYRSQPEVCRYLGHAAWTDLDQAREWITDSHAEGGGRLGIHAEGKGLAREAVGAVVQAGFERWGLHRIEARVFTGARPSSRLLADLGFTREGVLRQVVWSREGTWFDDEVWARLA